MQARLPFARVVHDAFSQGPDLVGRAGNSTQTVLDIGNEYFLSVPTANFSSATSTGGGGRSDGTTSTASAGSASPFVINVNWDASVGSAPAGFTAGVMKAVQFLESQFSNPVSITIDVGYGEVLGSALGNGVLGESATYLDSVSYSTLVNALKSHATTPADQGAVATLPTSNPTNGTFWVSTAEEKALDLPSGSSPDGFVGFSSSYPFTYDDSNGVASGTFDFNSVVLHELTEVMGRMLRDGGSIGGSWNSYFPLDLYHYLSGGVRDFSFSTPGYLSTNGGKTDSGDLNTVSGGDAGDWASSMGNDAFDAFVNSSVVNSFSADDLTAMSLLGWEPGVPPASPSPPAAVSASGNGATIPIPCFGPGTRIRTERGEVSVEELCIGDRVPAVRAGLSLPVVWIGHRQVQANRHPRPADVYPVRVATGAFADLVANRSSRVCSNKPIAVTPSAMPRQRGITRSTTPGEWRLSQNQTSTEIAPGMLPIARRRRIFQSMRRA